MSVFLNQPLLCSKLTLLNKSSSPGSVLGVLCVTIPLTLVTVQSNLYHYDPQAID